MICKQCGSANEDGSRFCIHCGAPLPAGAAEPVRPTIIEEPVAAAPAATAPVSRKRGKLGAIVGIIVATAAIILLVWFFVGERIAEKEADRSAVGSYEADYGASKSASSAGDDAGAAAAPKVTYLAETGAFAIIWPEGQPSVLDVEFHDYGTIISCGGTPVAEVQTVTQASASMGDERKHRVYSLKPTGGGEELTVSFFYLNADGHPAHWGDAAATELAIEKLASMSPDELLALFALPGAREAGGFAVELAGDDADSSASAAPTAGGQAAQSDAGASATAASGEPFWGIWAEASKSEAEAEGYAAEWRARGYDAEVVLTTDWSNLNSEPWYCVTLGRYGSESAAESALAAAQSAGYPDAYVKHSGEHR